MKQVIDVPISRRELLIGGAGAAAGLMLAGCGSSHSSAAATTSQGPPKRGGRLRVALAGGGEAETLNPFDAVSDIDQTRAATLCDHLTVPDGYEGKGLAESFEPNKDATEWTIRLRDGVRFHNGKPLNADDVIFSLRYIGRPGSPSSGATAVRVIDLKRLKKLDRLTFRAPLMMPIAQLSEWLGPNNVYIVPEGTTSFDPPIGTGPYIFVSWTKGVSSLFRRNPDYWDHPLPYTDELVLESLPNPTTRLDALLAGEVDAVSSLEFSDAKHYLASNSPIRVMVGKTSGMVPMTMAVNVPPFNDVRVRQAMRLVADRPALVADVTYGFGQIGNDVFGVGEQFYDSSLPQRHQDIDQAKSLLKAAGQENLTVQLNTSTAASGMLESATLFAQQAAEAGIHVNLHQYPASSYFDPPYLSWGFGQDYFTPITIPDFMSLVLLSNSPYNETHWRNAAFDKLYYDALGDLNDKTAAQKWDALQKIQYEQGGFLIWGTTAWVDGISHKVQGATPSSYSNLGGGGLPKWSFG